MKYLYAGGMSYEVYTKLIEIVVEPFCSIALAYGVPVNFQKFNDF